MEVLLHFSEDPHIAEFRPHVPASAPEAPPRVWAVDAAHAPSYWFPRDCPRACCWTTETQPTSATRALLGGATRLHAIEDAWLDRLRRCRLYVYRFDAAPFSLADVNAGYHTTPETVRPLSVEAVGDLLDRHREAGIALRIVPNLWPAIDAIQASGLAYSIIRKANALPRASS